MLVPAFLLLFAHNVCPRQDHGGTTVPQPDHNETAIQPLENNIATILYTSNKTTTTVWDRVSVKTSKDHNTIVPNDLYLLHGNFQWTQKISPHIDYKRQKYSPANATFYTSNTYLRKLRYDKFNNYVKHMYRVRSKRESHPLISTFDISRMFKKKKIKMKEATSDGILLPSVASLKSDRTLSSIVGIEDIFKTNMNTSVANSKTKLNGNVNTVDKVEIETIDMNDSVTKAPKAIPTIPTEDTILHNKETPTSIKKIEANPTPSKSIQNGNRQTKKTRKGKVRQTKGSGLAKARKAISEPPDSKKEVLVLKQDNTIEDLGPNVVTEATKESDVSVKDTKHSEPDPETKSPTKPELSVNNEEKDSNESNPNPILKQINNTEQEVDSTRGPEQMVMKPLKPRVMVKKNETAWPVKHAAVVEGDIVLGGLMMVHRRSEGATCGPVMAQGGVQALEAMLYALDRAAPLAPPSVAIGAHVLDDCDNDTYGLEMALDFIKGSISNIDDAEYACNATALRKVISGVVGAASSVTSVQVANLLRLFKIPQVSFFSTSPELSNKARFEYFTRTIPSDLHQVRAMVEIVKQLGWRYVSIIYEESNYGIKAFEELETLLARNSICIAVKERLVKDSGEADATAYDAIVARLLSRPRARGVIVFGSDQEVAGVMQAVTRARASNAFRWVGSDGWSARALVSEGNEEAVEGTISVQPQANEVKGFKEYFLQLTVENNQRNPWFVEFWEDHFHCRYPGSPRTPYNDYSNNCTGRERLTAQNTEFEAQLQFVADAVLAFAHAIRDMHNDLCGGKPGLCEAMQPASGPTLLRYLRRVNFTGLTGDKFQFDGNGDGPARYNILHFKQITRGVYRWLKVGQYLDGKLELDMKEVQFKWGERQPPESVCSAECELGQAKQYVEGESCCWHCFNCTQYEIRSPEVETACVECPRGTLPDVTRTRCAHIAEVYLRPDSAWAIGAMTFSSLGIIFTTFVLSVWVARGDTPVVRASGRELSFVLLVGIMMCYLVTFALVFRPTDILCALQRFGTGFCFTVVYAALLTKTNRIARIFDASKQSAKRPSLISPKSQLVICFILVSIQVVIVVVWQVVSPARAIHHYPTREDNMLVCDSYVDASYTIAFFYPILLILVCTVYAVLTRKIPEAFNESKHIGFTMYTTCVIWLSFVPLYFGTASHVPLRVTSMAVTISLSASVTLVCLFTPKLYIILVRPERNVRAPLMGGKWGAGGRGAAGGAVCAALVGAAPLPRAPDPTPSTDRSTLGDTDKTTLSDKYIQTDDVTANHRKATNGVVNIPNREDTTLPLNPSKLAELSAGLPCFDSQKNEGKRLQNGPPPGVNVLGGEIPL